MSFDYESPLETIAAIAAQHAASVDRGDFPTEAVRALGEAGLLGLVSATEVGGQGLGLPAAAAVVERLARECASTAMVLCMHYCGTAVIEKLGPERVRREIAGGRHLSTLAFSETGSRSHFWNPVSTAVRVAGGGVRLDARKSFSTSARHATAYVWSSRPAAAAGASTLWLVPTSTPGLNVPQPFDGLGLRGNDSAPVIAEGVIVPEESRLGEDGGGFAGMMEIVLPVFNVLASACSSLSWFCTRYRETAALREACRACSESRTSCRASVSLRSARSNMRLTAAASLTSAWAGVARPPAASMRATRLSASATLPAKLTTTVKPSAARRVAMAAPIPREAPVTMAICVFMPPSCEGE